MTTLNKTLEELQFEFSGINGILHDAFSLSGVNSVSSIKNNSNTTSRKRRYDNIDNIAGGINVMQTKFSEAENELLKKSSAQILSATSATTPQLDTYQNNLPYGVPAGNQVNQELYAVGENTWGQFSKDMGKIFKKVGKEQLNTMTSNNSLLKSSDIENLVYGTCGSLSEWPQINPKSAGMGKCSKLFEVFNKHYMGYSAAGSGLKASDFYYDLISSLHTAEVYGLSGKNKPTAITGFSNKVETYNINTDLWFLSVKDKEEAKYNGFAKTGEDSYGKFFYIGGFPVASTDYENVIIHMTANNGKIQYPSNDYNTFIQNKDALVNPVNGAFMRTSNNDQTIIFNDRNLVIMKDIEIDDGGSQFPKDKKLNKIYCSLFLNEGNKTNINKLEEMSYIKYLFNYRDNGFFPAISKFPNIELLTARHHDILITQRDPEIGLLLFLRMVFELEYPITRLNPVTAVGAGNGLINIFRNFNNIINGGGAGETLMNTYPTMPHAADDLNTVKRKLTTKITTLMQKFNGSSYYKDYIQTISLKFIDDIDKPGTNVTLANFPNSRIPLGHNVYDYNFNPFDNQHGYSNVGGIIDIFSQPLNNLDFGNIGNINNLFTHNPIQNTNFDSIPVKVYRHLIKRLSNHLITKIGALQPPAIRTNKYNLYDDDETHASALTASKETAGAFNDLTNYKQTISDINPVMTGGKSKSNNKIKIDETKTKRLSKKNQKGGTIANLFTGDAAPADLPKLYSNRKLQEFNPSLFKNAVQKYKELNFNHDYSTVKSLFDKISQIDSLPLFFDSYENTRTRTINTTTSGGCGVPPAGVNTTLSFNDIAQLFLFNSVNTTTTTLLIHFLKNVKACLNHFMTTDLKTASESLPANIRITQSDKIEGNIRELIKEIDKVVNFLKYNTLNLQEKTLSLNDSNNATFQFGNNEHYVKNLFLGANVFFSYAENADQFVVMRFTQADGAGAGAVNWQGDKFFEFLNRIVGCTENGNIFGNTLKFLTDSNNPVNDALNQYMTHIPIANPLQNNPYLQKIRGFIKDKPDGCFGGIPFVSLDPKTFSSLMRSFYLLLGLRLVVGKDIQMNNRIEEETAYSTLKQDTKDAIKKNIQDTLTSSAFSTLAESLKSQATIPKANMIFNTIFQYLFIQSRRIIAQVNQAKQEINKASKIGNKKNIKKGLFTGGGPTSIYTFRQASNVNTKNSLIKSQINFIKTTYQASAEFEYMMDEILIQLKKEIERRGVKNQLHFYYYMDTHFRNFKIYMTTYLLTIGDNNIPPEMSQKLQQYIGYSPDKNKAMDSYKKLTQVPLIDPQFSDPLWWAKIERKFMDIEEIGVPSSDTVYRLFIITTTPPNKLKMRDLYIIDAFALATLNDGRSQDKYWSTTGYRTHVGIRKAVDSAGNKIYLDTNTVIKLTGVGSTGIGLKQNSTKAIVYSQKITPFMDKNINKAIKGAINEDIRDLICGKYKYFDKKDNRYKTLIPLFLQASRNDVLETIVTTQKDIMFRGYEHKFRMGTNSDYRIYQLSDDYIKELKKYRQWLYQIFVEQQMQLMKPEIDKFDSIQTTMISSFKGWLFSTNTTGKCTRVYNIYDYIVLQATDAAINATTGNKKMSTFRNPTDPYKPGRPPATIDFKSIRSQYPNLSNTYDLGAKMMAGFISRESLIKLMLIY